MGFRTVVITVTSSKVFPALIQYSSSLTLCPYLECLDSHGEVVLLPDALVNLSVLTPSQLVFHGDVGALHLPLVIVGRHAIDGGLVAFGRGVV